MASPTASTSRSSAGPAHRTQSRRSTFTPLLRWGLLAIVLASFAAQETMALPQPGGLLQARDGEATHRAMSRRLFQARGNDDKSGKSVFDDVSDKPRIGLVKGGEQVPMVSIPDPKPEDKDASDHGRVNQVNHDGKNVSRPFNWGRPRLGLGSLSMSGTSSSKPTSSSSSSGKPSSSKGKAKSSSKPTSSSVDTSSSSSSQPSSSSSSSLSQPSSSSSSDQSSKPQSSHSSSSRMSSHAKGGKLAGPTSAPQSHGMTSVSAHDRATKVLDEKAMDKMFKDLGGGYSLDLGKLLGPMGEGAHFGASLNMISSAMHSKSLHLSSAQNSKAQSYNGPGPMTSSSVTPHSTHSSSHSKHSATPSTSSTEHVTPAQKHLSSSSLAKPTATSTDADDEDDEDLCDEEDEKPTSTKTATQSQPTSANFAASPSSSNGGIRYQMTSNFNLAPTTIADQPTATSSPGGSSVQDSGRNAGVKGGKSGKSSKSGSDSGSGSAKSGEKAGPLPVDQAVVSNDVNYGFAQAQDDLYRIRKWAGDSNKLVGKENRNETLHALFSAASRYYPEIDTKTMVRVMLADIKTESDFESSQVSGGRIDSGDSVGLLQVSPKGASQEMSLFKKDAQVKMNTYSWSAGKGDDQEVEYGATSGLGPLLDFKTNKPLDLQNLSEDDLKRPWVNIHVAMWLQSNYARTGSQDPSEWPAIAKASRAVREAYKAQAQKSAQSQSSASSSANSNSSSGSESGNANSAGSSNANNGGDANSAGSNSSSNSMAKRASPAWDKLVYGQKLKELNKKLKGKNHKPPTVATGLGSWVAGPSSSSGGFETKGDDISKQYFNHISEGLSELFEGKQQDYGKNFLDTLELTPGLVDFGSGQSSSSASSSASSSSK